MVEREKPEYLSREKPEQRRTHMMINLGIEPEPHWWEVSALTIVPALLPNSLTDYNLLFHQAYIKLKDFDSAIEDCNLALKASYFNLIITL